jgi:hypothetical protein
MREIAEPVWNGERWWSVRLHTNATARQHRTAGRNRAAPRGSPRPAVSNWRVLRLAGTSPSALRPAAGRDGTKGPRMRVRNELGRIGYLIGSLLAILFVMSVVFMPANLRQMAQRSEAPAAEPAELDTAFAAGNQASKRTP